MSLVKRIGLVALIALVVMGLAAASASANIHQSHMGACARETENIKVGVSDLQANGVATQFAAHFRIHPIDGNVVKRMDKKLVIGEAVESVTMHDTGCNGHGENFPWHNRTVEKGEHVVVNPPASIGAEACKHPHEKGCNATTIITVETLLPVSCWNRLYVLRIKARVRIWLRKKHHHKKSPSKKPPSKPETPAKPAEAPKEKEGCNSTNSGVASGIGAVMGSCNSVTVYPCTNCTVTTEVECSSAASGGTATGGSTGGSATSSTSCPKEEKTVIVVVPPEEKPCGCEEKHEEKEKPCGCKEKEKPCETCECKGTPEECHPKNGEEGAGHGSGGEGEGCAAGYTRNGKECVPTGNGQEGKGGGEGGYCIDPETELVREMRPGETKDQYEYCSA